MYNNQLLFQLEYMPSDHKSIGNNTGNTKFSPPAANTPLGINCLFYAQPEPICSSPRGLKDHKCTVYRLSTLDENGVCDLQKTTNAQFTAFPG